MAIIKISKEVVKLEPIGALMVGARGRYSSELIGYVEIVGQRA